MKPSTNPNDRQIGGDHYKTGGEEHWDRVNRLGLDYFQAAITKYVERCWKKNGVEDLEKAQHFLEKYISLKKAYPTLPVADSAAENFRLVNTANAGSIYRCMKCGERIFVPIITDPYTVHGDCAGRGYIAQG
jgi:DNA-directed RNA polymerase subunit RPC12/RpoP